MPRPRVIEEEVEKRRHRGRAGSFDVVNRGEAAVLSSFSVSGAGGRSYTVELRSLHARVNRCTCRDFQTNALGTCKHIEAVFYHLEQRYPEQFSGGDDHSEAGRSSAARPGGGGERSAGDEDGGSDGGADGGVGGEPRPFPPVVPDTDPAPDNLERFYGAKVIVFDLETQRGTEAVRSARDLRALRVSVGVAYHFVDGTFRQYGEPEMGSLIESLFEADCVVGYNIRRFDIPVLRGYTRRQLGRLPLLDLMDDFARKKGRSLRLNRLAHATLGTAKSGDGAQAIQLFRQGEWGRLVSYCRDDVRITRDLMLAGIANGCVWTEERSGERVALPVAWEDEVARRCGLQRPTDSSANATPDAETPPRRKAE